MAATLEQFPILDPVACNEALQAFRHLGNPFRNHFARNSDDEACGRFHVPELYARERSLLLGLIDQFRGQAAPAAEILPVLGNKGAGKTHLLHSIKHGDGAGFGGIHLLVTPGTYQRDTDFLEYLLFQVIDTLLGGGRHGRERPLLSVGEIVVARILCQAIGSLSNQEKIELFPPPLLGRWLRNLGLGCQQAEERCGWLLSQLSLGMKKNLVPGTLGGWCQEAGLSREKAVALVIAHSANTAGRSSQGLMRSAVLRGFARAVFLGDEADLASFLTYGFAELDFNIRPTRQDLVLSLFKGLLSILREVRVPVFVAFDQLEDLLLARRGEDVHKIAECFFAGIVQCMHQLQGIGFLLFAERGLWNRFIPSLDGYMRDRLTNPVHLPGQGTVQALRLDPPAPELVRMVVEARLRGIHSSHGCFSYLPPFYPFQLEQIDRIARTEATLRDMLQQFRQIFDTLVFGKSDLIGLPSFVTDPLPREETPSVVGNSFKLLSKDAGLCVHSAVSTENLTQSSGSDLVRISTQMPSIEIRSVVEVEVCSEDVSEPINGCDINDLWELEVRSALRQLNSDGATVGATREIQAGLGLLLRLMNDHGVRVGPWRLQHVVEGFDFGDHPTYGVISLAHWTSRNSNPWKVGVGLFLGRGQGKPRDLQAKLSCFQFDPVLVDHLILLRPEDDMNFQGKSRQIWQEMEQQGKHARMEPVGLDFFALMYALPRILATASESRQASIVSAEMAFILSEKYDGVLRQVSMPILEA